MGGQMPACVCPPLHIVWRPVRARRWALLQALSPELVLQLPPHGQAQSHRVAEAGGQGTLHSRCLPLTGQGPALLTARSLAFSPLGAQVAEVWPDPPYSASCGHGWALWSVVSLAVTKPCSPP